MRLRRVAGALLTTVVVLMAAGPAQGAKLPTYRSPGFEGTTKAPATKPAPPPVPVPLSASGTFPDVLVDDAGTAHIVWNEDRGDGADAAVYCRLKRGATQCDASAALVPAKSYGTGDGPQFDIDNGGPKIMRIGDQLVVLSYRYPTFFDRPDGVSGSGAVVEWTSDDGGTTWSGGNVAAREDIVGGAVPFGADGAPRIATISQEGYCGTCVGQVRPGAYDPAAANLGAGLPDANYNGSLAVDGGLPVAAFSDLTNHTFVRRWSGSEPLTDASTWSPPLTVDGDEPFLSGGAAGLWLMNRTAYGKPLVVRKIQGGAVGAPQSVTTPKSIGVFGRLEQDPSGRLLAAWESRETAKDAPAGMYLRTGAGGALGPARLLLAGDGAGQPSLAATADGGGFLVANTTGGVNSAGPIAAAAFGSGALTGKPGLGDLTGGSAPGTSQTCSRVTFGAVRVGTDVGCFLHGTGAYAKVSVTDGAIDLNGLRVVPDDGVKIVIDPKSRKLYTTGAVRVLLVEKSLTVTLWHGPLAIELPSAGTGTVLASFDTSKFGVDLAGFGVAGRVDVILTPDGVKIPVALKLPPYMGDIRGEATLLAKSGSGLELDSLHIHVGNLFLGPLLIDYFDLTYASEGERWTGSARMHFPPPGVGGALDASVEFDGGRFKSGTVGYTPPPPGIVIGPLVYLTKFGGTFGLDPTHIGISGRVGAGAAVNGVSPVNVDGTMDMTFPSGGPFTLQAHGTVSLFLLDVGDADFKFVSDGFASFHGHVGLPLPVISIDGDVDGFADGRSKTYGTNAKVKVCVDLTIAGVSFPCVDGDLALSPKGMAACASASLPDPTSLPPGKSTTFTAGLELPWDALTPAMLVNPLVAAGVIGAHLRTPCHTSDYRAVPAARTHGSRAVAAGASTTVQIPAGLPTATIALVGDGGAPDVTVQGPSGQAPAPGSPTLRAAAASTTYVVLNRPAAGSWTITAQPGSAPITSVLQSSGYVPATVHAKLGGRGRARTVAYRIDHLGSGQTVTFQEVGASGTRTLGTTTKASGTLRFTTGDGRGGRRTVVALTQNGGFVTDRLTVGRYVAPGPQTLARPRRVHVTQRRTTATVTWRAVPGASRYVVAVRGTHGLRQQFVTRKRRVGVTRLAPGDRITATVRGQTATGRLGPSARG